MKHCDGSAREALNVSGRNEMWARNARLLTKQQVDVSVASPQIVLVSYIRTSDNVDSY